MKKTLRLLSLLLVLAMGVVMLASCGIGSYEKRLEDAGYDVEVVDDDDIKEMNEKSDDYEVKEMLYAGKGLNSVTVVKLASSKQAEDFAEDMEKANILDVLAEVKVDGKVVIYGTKDAVKAAMGD